MKAVFQCTKKYYSLSREMILNSYDVRSVGGYVRDYGFSREVYKPSEYVGTSFFVDDSKPLPSFRFYEGKDHNQITLTEPTEIVAMRAYIKKRGRNPYNDPQFTEVSFEGDEAELEAVTLPVYAPEMASREIYSSNTAAKQRIAPENDDGLSELDLQILSNMRYHDKRK